MTYIYPDQFLQIFKGYSVREDKQKIPKMRINYPNTMTATIQAHNKTKHIVIVLQNIEENTHIIKTKHFVIVLYNIEENTNT